MRVTGLLVVLGLAAGAFPALPQEPWSTDADVRFVREEDQSVLRLGPAQAILTLTRVSPGGDSTLEGLLRDRGIHPDPESIGEVLSLNPGLDASTGLAGRELLIPALTAGPAVKEALDSGYLAYVTFDVAAKSAYLADVSRLAAVAQDPLFELPAPQETQEAVVQSVGFLKAISVTIRERTLFIDEETIAQLRGQAHALLGILSEIGEARRSPTERETRVILSICDDLKARSGYLTGARSLDEHSYVVAPRSVILSPRSEVIVRTFAEGRREVGDLRVYYLPEALYWLEGTESPQARQFAQLTSPSSQSLPVANYRIWASEPGDQQPITDVIQVQVRSEGGSESKECQLVVRKP